MKKVALELGGKNPNIVFADADREAALDFALTAVFLHSGQVCSAGARLVVEESIHDEFVDELVAPGASRSGSAARSTRRPRPAPLISAGAPRQGRGVRRRPGSPRARRCAAAAARPDDPALADGFYYLPTCSTAARSGMRVVQDESFGPVLTVETFTDEDDAVRDRQRHHLRPRRRGVDPGRRQGASGSRPGCGWARCGSTTTTRTSPQAEWGGYKQSGIGRELGAAGLEEYRETKHVWHNIAPAPQRWFDGAIGDRTASGVARA